MTIKREARRQQREDQQPAERSRNRSRRREKIWSPQESRQWKVIDSRKIPQFNCTRELYQLEVISFCDQKKRKEKANIAKHKQWRWQLERIFFVDKYLLCKQSGLKHRQSSSSLLGVCSCVCAFYLVWFFFVFQTKDKLFDYKTVFHQHSIPFHFILVIVI